MKKRLFISYSKDNHEVAKRLLMHLENQNAVHDNFLEFFLDTQRLKAGFEYDPVIEQNLKCAEGYLFLASIDALSSPYIQANELPAMAFEHRVYGCPLFLFLVSNVELGISVPVDGSDNPLNLARLEPAGPKLENGRPAWFEQLPPEERESALYQSAKDICEVMLDLNLGKRVDCVSRVQPQPQVRPVRPANLVEKPRVNRYIAYLDRYQIADSLKVELAEHQLVAVAARVVDSDWIEGVALRLGYERLTTLEGEDNRPHAFDLEWPLLSLDQVTREKTLWLPLLEGLSIQQGSDLQSSLERLWERVRERLHKQVRLVVHYKLRDSKSKAKRDKRLLQALVGRWKDFLQGLDDALPGRVILLFSLNQDTEPAPGWRAWMSEGPLELEDLSEVLQQALPHERSCVIDGGALGKIVSGDTERWKRSVAEAQIDETQADAIIMAVEESIPDGGIRHRNLMKAIKQNPGVRSLFKVT